MSESNTHTRFVSLLVATTIAAYVLIALGTAVSTTGSAETCTTWPSCSSEWAVGPITSEGLLFWGHRGAALVTAALLAGAAVAATRLDLGRITRAGLVLACVLFPVQIVVGAVLVVRESMVVGAVHLVLAMGIFVGLLAALTRTLEARIERGTSNTEHASEVAPGPTVRPIGDGGSDRPFASGSPPTDDPIDERPADRTDSSASTAPATVESRLIELRRTAGAYLTLTKPKLMWLLCLVALAGMGLATVTGASLEPGVAVATLLGGVLAIGAAGTFNHVYERDRDRRMQRTADRPLVHDRVPVANAVCFGVVLAVASTAVMLAWVNLLATLLTLAAIAYYVVLYTILLKPNTSWNTVLGGGAGAIPALIGWAAVTNEIGLPALVLAAMIFLWTPAHFYSFAIAHREDYARGGFPMLPVVAGDLLARRHTMLFLGATLLSASLLGWIAGLGWLYALTSVALGAIFLRSVVQQYRDPGREVALQSFYASNYYLGAILIAVVLETLIVA